jgi:hypothetical protein
VILVVVVPGAHVAALGSYHSVSNLLENRHGFNTRDVAKQLMAHRTMETVELSIWVKSGTLSPRTSISGTQSSIASLIFARASSKLSPSL